MGEKIRCPYCNHTFPVRYYDQVHVPCPEMLGTMIRMGVIRAPSKGDKHGS